MENQFGMTTEQHLRMAVESLTGANESLTRTNERQSRQISELTEEVKKMAAKIAWFQKQMFGRKSEKHIAIDNQPGLFEATDLDTPAESPGQPEEAPEEEEITYRRRKSQKGTSKSRETWDNLPILETRIIEPEGGVDLTGYRRMGEETTYLVGFEPGKYYRIAVVRPKYGLIDPTEPVERGKGVLIAPLPKFPYTKASRTQAF